MRLTIRSGSDQVARADRALLAAMGLPGGGVIRVGRTHALVRPGDTAHPNDLVLPADVVANSGVAAGTSLDVPRSNLPGARRVVFAGESLPGDRRHLARALQGRPLTAGDRLTITPGEGSTPVALEVLEVDPDGAALVGGGTLLLTAGDGEGSALTAHDPGLVPGDGPTTAQALVAGLDSQLETLSGWLRLLTGAEALPRAWGLPRVAGVVLEGPSGCGKSELVAVAAERAGATVQEVTVDLVFKPERLVDVLDRAVKGSAPPHVLFVDRLDAVAGADGLFRTQAGAIMRWFLDAVADRDGVACVVGVTSADALDPSVSDSPLLPRTLAVPPPDLKRRRMLLEAALARVPHGELDLDALAARTAGFSGSDVVAAVVHASALSVGRGDPITDDLLGESIAATPPSLGALPGGEIPAHGFEAVANLTEVKQRLTEAVIWPITDPGRFARLGIEPPRGLLLHGPPGTGKTFVIGALAHESGAAFFPVKGAELLDKYVGESERGVREIFARARAAAPSILFFDEVDALAPVRGRSTTSVTDSVVAALLTEMDGITGRGDVVVIGATNRIDLVDPALLRPGRLESHIHLGLPPTEARRALLTITDLRFAPEVDLDALAESTEGLSFADLTGLLREAALQALRSDPAAMAVSTADLAAARSALSGGRS